MINNFVLFPLPQIVFAALLSVAAAVPAYGGYGYAAPALVSSYGYSTAIPAPVAIAAPVYAKSYAVAAPAVIAAPVASYGLGYGGKGLIGGYGGLGYGSGLALGGYGGYGLGYGKGLY